MQHVAIKAPFVESGKAHAYRLRGTTAEVRASEAVNGVPTISPPYTDSQLCALYRLTRAELKLARHHASRPPQDNEISPALLDSVVRTAGAEATWEALQRILNEQQA